MVRFFMSASLLFIFTAAAATAKGIISIASIDSSILIAKQYLKDANYANAIIQYRSCLREAKELKKIGLVGAAYAGIGIAYDRQGIYDIALKNYFEALRAFEADGNIKKQAGTFKNIGNVYRTVKSYDKSYNFLNLSFQKFSSIKDSTGLANVTNDIGLLNMDRGNNDKAISSFLKIIQVYSKHAIPEVIAYANNNLGLCYTNNGRYREAEKHYSHALQLMQQLKDDYGQALILTNLGDLLNKKQLYKQSVQYSEKGLAMSRRIGSKELIASAYDNLATSFRKQGNYSRSNSYLNSLLKIKDTIFKEESTKSYAEMESGFQNERKQKEILLLKQDNLLKTLDLAFQQKTKYLLLIGLSIVSAFLILLFRNNKIKRQLNNELNSLNEKLQEANQSKTKLLGIISHDLRSPVSSLFSYLAVLKNNPSRLSETEKVSHNNKIALAAEGLLEAMEDVLVWSKSQMEAFNPVEEEVLLNAVLDEVIKLNETAALNKDIKISKACPKDLWIATDPNFLKIIIRNLLSNAIKFSPEHGEIYLTALQQGANINLIVKDLGCGIPSDQIPNLFEWNSIRSDSSGLGLKLVKEFTEKLKGSVTLNPENQEGAEFVLSFNQT